MKYLAILGRQPEISIAELEALSGVEWHQMPFSGRSSRPSSRGSSLRPRSDCGCPSKEVACSRYIVTLTEGRNRQIRRTFAALGYRVTKLHRTNFGAYELGSLKPGDYREFGI